ncbi:MAG: PD-(D/E)XK nuclease family protein [Gammaproteobacteria bacterium]|nr:PD-(D/E)XK nuclease family protein [Gammaproteobacteria bacterium]NNF61844.1 hypothetical protein [Gammaproteobacteria bacterium]
MPALSERIRDALSSGAVVVTSSKRLSNEIRRNYASGQAEKGVQAWQRGRVLAWQQWLRTLGEQVLWSGYASPAGRRQLLTPLQERLLWERIVSQSDYVPLNIRATAQLARQAWGALQEWRMPDPGTVGFSSREENAFSAWMKAYHETCVARSWLDSARVIDSLVPAIGSGAVPVPGRVLLVGFSGFNPQQRALLRALTNMGTRLGMVRAEQGSSAASMLTLHDQHAELETAARWLRSRVVSNPDARLALVVPDLDETFQRVERVLDKAFLPGSFLPGAGEESERPYGIAAGRPLRKQPVVVAADHVLALSMGSVSMRVLSRIIRSPFIAGGISEAARRARFDAWMREKGSVDVDMRHVPGMLEAFRHHTGIATGSFRLETLFENLAQRDSKPAPQPPSNWARSFTELLETFGWPGEGQRDAVQRQAQRDFDSLLSEFASLDVVLGDIGAVEALRLLRHLLRERQFEYHARNVPIWVLNPEDAEWLSFDHLWICDATNQRWTGAFGEPNPFVPVEWQRNHKLPGSAPALRIGRAEKMVRQLIAAAPEVVVSRSSESDTGFQLAVFSALPSIAAQDLELADLTDYRPGLPGLDEIEQIDDGQGPRLDPVETIDLDQDVLALQSACPFRSFAVQRLGAQPLRALRPGVRPEARVVLVRMALEHMWHRIESSDVLQAALTGEHLEVQIWEVADTVLAVFERKLPVRLSKRYRALEHARLVRLLLHWLRIETDRAPFEVRQTNVQATVEMAGVSLRAHVDRVDHVDNRGLAIIDYDTTPFQAGRWLGERPDAPSLLLYALATEEEPVALLTGCVSAEQMNLAGVQHELVVSDMPVYEQSELAEKTGLDWDDLLDAWRSTLETLTAEFAGGIARVQPKYGPETCSDCHLGTLCRIADKRSGVK